GIGSSWRRLRAQELPTGHAEPDDRPAAVARRADESVASLFQRRGAAFLPPNRGMCCCNAGFRPSLQPLRVISARWILQRQPRHVRFFAPKADSRTAVIGDAIRLFCQGGRTTAAGPKVAIPARFSIGLGL